MYFRLVLRNMKHSIKNYIVYFITIILTVSLMYSFIALIYDSNVLKISDNIKVLRTGIIIISILVSLISSFMINYSIQFILTQRKKEFALYNLFGIEKLKICSIFIFENIFFAFIAFIIGILIGTNLANILTKIIMNIFDMPYSFKIINISKNTIILITIFYSIMYGIGIFKSAKVIKHQKIIELLYDIKKNENLFLIDNKKVISKIIIFFVEIILGIVLLIKALFFTSTNIAFLYIIFSLFFILFGSYKLYCIIPRLSLTIYDKKEKWKLSNTNLFLYGQIRTRVSNIGKIMGIMSILITASLFAIFFGISMSFGYKANIKAEYPYDVSVAFDAKVKDFDDIINFVNNIEPVKDNVFFYLYENPDYEIDILSISDYNKIRKQLGLTEKEIKSSQYLIHCDTWSYLKEIKKNLKENPNIRLNNKTLTGNENYIYTEQIEQFKTTGTNGYSIIVPDDIVLGLETHKSRLIVTLINGGSPDLKSSLYDFIYNKWQPEIIDDNNNKITISVSVKAWGLINSLIGFVSISFCGLYLSIIFIIFSCTILATKQLSEIEKNQLNYNILEKLGISYYARKKIIFKETLFIFSTPILIPLILIIICSIILNYSFGKIILYKNLFLICMVITIIIFAIIYIIYFLITYFIYNNLILKNK